MKKAFYSFCLILLANHIGAQTIIISGPTSVSAGATEYYEANFDYTPYPFSNISWTVSEGTIISQSTNPTGLVWCTVQWDNTSGSGSISIDEDIYNGYSQETIDIGDYLASYSIMQDITYSPTSKTAISCSSISTSNCNLILNNNFNLSTNTNELDPFTVGDVTNWVSSHGSPQTYDGFYPTLQAPSPATGFAYMYSSSPISQGPSIGEGIAQKIPALTQGFAYKLSFFIRFSEMPSSVGGSSQLDHLYFALINCSDYNSFPNPAYSPPAFPTNSQIVYHGTSLTNSNWVEVEVTFTADAAYNMIWIFPNQTSGGSAGIDFAYPILTDLNSFAITPTGPINICTPWEYAPTNSQLLTSSTTASGQYQWYKDGQAISGATNQTFYAQHYQQGVFVRTHLFSVQDPVNGCSSASVTVNFVPTPLLPYQEIGNFCRNVWYTILTTENLSPATYTWSIPGATINDVNINDQYVDVLFPSTATSGLTGTVTINGGASCVNETYTYHFLLYSSCRNSNNVNSREIDELNKNSTTQKNKIIPNPASSTITILSSNVIKKLEIFSVFGSLVKQVQIAKKSEILDINSLKPGLYFCKIYSDNGIEVLRFIVER